MIKTITKFATGAALAVAVLAPTAALASDGSFTIVNKNGSASIQRVWYAEAGNSSDPWKEVYLDYPIKAGTDSRFTMNPGNTCMYDLKVQFSDGYTSTFSNVNVCRGDKANAY